MNQIVEEMQTYYARRAPVFDASMGYNSSQTVEQLAPVIDLLRNLMRDKRALEVACGPCFWTKFVSETARSILAIDFNESTLDWARQKPLNGEKISLAVADAYHLGAVSGRFDGAFAVDWFAHVPRSRFHEFLVGLHRKLESNSRIVFCDQLPAAHSLTGVYDEEGNHIQQRTLPDGFRYRVIKNYLTDQEIIMIFSKYSDEVEISRFPACGRIVVSYLCNNEQIGGADT